MSFAVISFFASFAFGHAVADLALRIYKNNKLGNYDEP
jgi:hypothetical protein